MAPKNRQITAAKPGPEMSAPVVGVVTLAANWPPAGVVPVAPAVTVRDSLPQLDVAGESLVSPAKLAWNS
jgi:hypothetical protein